ncbi:MAG: hypothetical protein M3P30_00120 [Chloroflexota bacterium]|nr:hypothetical protein [Chloroflexota bacterium]
MIVIVAETMVLLAVDGLFLVLFREHWRTVAAAPFTMKISIYLSSLMFGAVGFIIPVSVLGTKGLVVAIPGAFAGIAAGLLLGIYHLWARGMWNRQVDRLSRKRPDIASQLQHSKGIRWLLRIRR